MSIKHVIFLVPLLFPAIIIADEPVLEHDLSVEFNRGDRSFMVSDHIALHNPHASKSIGLPDFSLNPDWRLTSLAFDGEPVQIDLYVDNGRILTLDNARELSITYTGTVDQLEWPYITWLPGDGWYPEAEAHRVRFKLDLRAPAGWNSLTQGIPSAQTTSARRTWVQQDPQQGIYLVAGPWHGYGRQVGDYRARVMLIEDDGEFANLYLDAALEHLERYSTVLGAYPYHDFTLVENKYQTGWGMPGFTLLGSKVIRLPFILNTSFPHEILHNWWGNGVFVSTGGNWSEGLTAYLSDYLSRERGGGGRQYRLDALIAWHDFAARRADFPLSRFTARHDRASQAVGYGKGMFLFHMLRGELGDHGFLAGLRDLYSGFLFKHASFADIRNVFEGVCNCSLDGFFAQWTGRAGAPELRLDAARSWAEHGEHRLTVDVSQHGGQPWDLRVPVQVIDIEGRVMTRFVRLDRASDRFTLELDAPPARVDIDPEVELFRKLAADENPPTFSKVFAAAEVAILIADDSFSEVAKIIGGRYRGWRVAANHGGERVDTDVIMLLGGDQTRAAEWFAAGRPDRYRITPAGIEIEGVSHALDQGKVIALVDEVVIDDTAKTVMWISSQRSDGLDDLLRRLSHYGRFSYAIFDAPDKRAAERGQWRAEARSLRRVFAAGTPAGAGSPSPPLF